MSKNKTNKIKDTSHDPREEYCLHVFTTREAKEPTCTEPGWTENVFCVFCGETLKEYAVIPAKGHRFGEWKTLKEPTPDGDGLYERVCKCGAKETKNCRRKP